MEDAMVRVASIADLAGTYALTLDALDEGLVAYYRQFGFESFKEGTGLEMYLPLLRIKRRWLSRSVLSKYLVALRK
jgi:hypothetical protein